MTPAKNASARTFLLALALAALALSGCGGGSSDSSSPDNSEGSSASVSTSASADASGAAAPSGASGETGTGTSAAKDVPGGDSAAGGNQPSTGTKHGPQIAQPKGEEESGITPEQRREATVASMILQSPSSQSSSGGPRTLPAEYTCDGKNTSPALRWQGVPPGTAELVLFAMNTQPVEGGLFFDWAVAGLSPELEEIEVGKLPNGAVVGRNGFGKTAYGICPEGAGETYMFALFALPKQLSPSQGFEPIAVRKAVNEAAGNVGLLALGYARG